MTQPAYILIDALNLFHRSRHCGGGRDIDMKVGMCLHIMFNSVRKAYRDLNGGHVVLCMDGRSWRKDHYQPYKKNREAARQALTTREAEEMEVYFEAFDEMCSFFLEKTNATVLRSKNAEADDIIATWIDLHPDDNHVIVSSDSDFVQLVAPNVKLFNGVTGVVFAHDHVLDEKGRRCSFEVTGHGKLKVHKPDEKQEIPENWQELALFIKCIRGDKSDNVFPAYPGVRFKGTRNKVGIMEAFQDQHLGGFNWNNFMLQRWSDDRGQERLVREEYERNRELIDLRAQPQHLREQFVEDILTEIRKDPVSGVGIHFLRFCSQWDLQNIAKYPDEFAQILNQRYQGPLLEGSGD